MSKTGYIILYIVLGIIVYFAIYYAWKKYHNKSTECSGDSCSIIPLNPTAGSMGSGGANPSGMGSILY